MVEVTIRHVLMPMIRYLLERCYLKGAVIGSLTREQIDIIITQQLLSFLKVGIQLTQEHGSFAVVIKFYPLAKLHLQTRALGLHPVLKMLCVIMRIAAVNLHAGHGDSVEIHLQQNDQH